MINNYFLCILLQAVNHPCAKEMFFIDNSIEYLYDIINKNSIEELNNLLQKDPSKAKRLFFYSLFNEKFEIALLLINYIEDVNEKFFLDNCFLQASTQFNDIPTTKKLLSMGANPNPSGQHPLVNAILQNNNEIFDLLLQYGSNIEFSYPYINQANNEIFNKILNNITIENLCMVNFFTKNIERKRKINEIKRKYLEPIFKILKNEDILNHIENYL